MTPRETMRHWGARTNENPPRYFGPSPLCRVERIRENAARLNRQLLKRPAKQYAPLLSPQGLSELRHRGGCVAGMGVLFLAEPAAAQVFAAHVQGLADMVSGNAREVVMAARLADKDDGAEDRARHELLAAMADQKLTVKELRELVDACDAQIASTRTLRHAAAELLETMERGES